MMSDKMTKDQALDVIDDVADLVGTSAFEDVKALDLVTAFKKAQSKSEPAQVSQPDEWIRAQAICDLPLVDEAIRGFAEDQTGDNGTMIVREVLRSIKPDQNQLLALAMTGCLGPAQNHECGSHIKRINILHYENSTIKAENEALKAENNLLKEVEKSFADLSENLQKDCEALKAEITRLQYEVVNRTRRALDGDLAVQVRDAVLAENEALELRVAELESESRTKHEYAMQMLGERDRLQNERDALSIAYRRRESIIFPVSQPASEPKDDLP